MIGELNGIVDLELSPIAQLYLLSMAGVILLMGILFSRESFKSDDPEIKYFPSGLYEGWGCAQRSSHGP